jgi:CRP-like cAMP-binding protein
MPGLVAHLQQLTPLEDATRAAIAAHCQTVRYRKRHQLVATGQTGQHLYYVEEGLAKIFHLQDGREVVDWFSDAQTLLCTLPSFIAHQPSRCAIQLLEDSELTSISLVALEALCLRFPDLALWRQRWVEQVVLLLQNRHHARQEPSAARRYASFSTQYPSLLPRVPLGDLASYLGMTAVTLSRVRARG